MRDRGSMTVAMTGALTVLALAAVAVTSLASLYGARAQAQVAADAAALAAAVSTYPPASSRPPLDAAREIAERNGAEVTGCRCARDRSLSARTVEVVTHVDVEVPVFGSRTVRATGRAEFDPSRWLGR